MTKLSEVQKIGITSLNDKLYSVITWLDGSIGVVRYRSKPTGVKLEGGNIADIPFLNAFIAQQLPMANIHILGVTIR